MTEAELRSLTNCKLLHMDEKLPTSLEQDVNSLYDSLSALNDSPKLNLSNSSCNSSDGSTKDDPGFAYPSCAPVGWKWVILDGPVDPSWVENLNSTLDDSKLLCLANGERIQLLPGMRLLFEIDSLSNSSPATVSRCGMIYIVSMYAV